MLSDARDILDFSKAQLRYIPKIVLLQKYGAYMHLVYDRLPEHLKIDSEVRGYRRCLEHYNCSWHRDHIDGPPRMIKDCSECARHAK